MFCVQMATTFMKCTETLELCTYTDVSFFLHCWLACRQGLAAAGVTPIQVQAHWFDWHQTLVFLPPHSPSHSYWAGC
jgi:hypothetical protein